MDDLDICFVADRAGAVTFIQWSRDDAAELVRVKLLATEKTDTSGGIQGALDVIGGGSCWVAFQDGIPLVLLVLQKWDMAQGRELEIRAAIALSGRPDATETVLPEVERVFGADCHCVALITRRPGLVRKLERAGYGETGKILRKKINV